MLSSSHKKTYCSKITHNELMRSPEADLPSSPPRHIQGTIFLPLIIRYYFSSLLIQDVIPLLIGVIGFGLVNVNIDLDFLYKHSTYMYVINLFSEWKSVQFIKGSNVSSAGLSGPPNTGLGFTRSTPTSTPPSPTTSTTARKHAPSATKSKSKSCTISIYFLICALEVKSRFYILSYVFYNHLLFSSFATRGAFLKHFGIMHEKETRLDLQNVWTALNGEKLNQQVLVFVSPSRVIFLSLFCKSSETSQWARLSGVVGRTACLS